MVPYTLKRLHLSKLWLEDLFVVLEHEKLWLKQIGKWEAENLHSSVYVEAGWEFRRGRQVITDAVLSRDEKVLSSSVDSCQMEEGGTLKEVSKSDILEERIL